jgi:TPR repeat protein
MRSIAVVAVAALCAVVPASAGDGPPQVTWDWYRAAEILRDNPDAHPDQLKVAANYHRMAAEKGNAASAYKLAEMYENNVGVRQNYQEALKWYLMAAKRGDKHAEFRLGVLHQKGLGTPPDPVAAISWYQRAAQKDNEWAYHMMAFMYADGEGVRRDARKAKAYFEKSLPRTKDHWAQFKLAALIERENPGRARKLLRQSAAAGNADAIVMLAEKGW